MWGSSTQPGDRAAAELVGEASRDAAEDAQWLGADE